jgi:hypothetical protein
MNLEEQIINDFFNNIPKEILNNLIKSNPQYLWDIIFMLNLEIQIIKENSNFSLIS